MRLLPSMLLAIALTALGACGDTAKLPVEAGFGAKPELPAPNQTLLPTVNIAPPQGWTGGAQPTSAPGTRVNAFASGLLPNGDVLVAETNAPVKSGAGDGIRGWVAKKIMAHAGAGVPGATSWIASGDMPKRLRCRPSSPRTSRFASREPCSRRKKRQPLALVKDPKLVRYVHWPA